MSGSATIRLVQGSEDSVFVEGDDDAQQALSLDLEGSTLRVRPSGTWKFWRGKPQQIVVTARDLKRVEISGAGDVIAPDLLQMRQLQVRISGAGFGAARQGQGRLARVQRLRLRLRHDDRLRPTSSSCASRAAVPTSARTSSAQSANVTVSGAGDVKVWATKELTASVSGVATVDFWGSAAVRRTSSGLTTWNEHGPKR